MPKTRYPFDFYLLLAVNLAFFIGFQWTFASLPGYIQSIGGGAAAIGLALVCLTAFSGCERVVSTEEGTASFYAKSLEGNRTASGEPYRSGGLTAAHRTLRFGTKVRVTNLDNGKSVTVRVNDRGPHVKGRIIDLSYRAAKKIGMVEKGSVKVRLEVLQ